MERSLIKGVISAMTSNLKDVSLDLAETVLDSALKEGVIKDIPGIGLLYSIGKAGADIRNQIFIHKLHKFLYELSDIPQEDRVEFIEKLNNSEEYRNSVGEKVISILDKADESEKAKMIGKLLKACIQGNYSFNTFLRISFIINNTFVGDLKTLGRSFQAIGTYSRLSIDLYANLYRVGLADTKIKVDELSKSRYRRITGTDRDHYDYTFEYKLNNDAYILAKEVFDVPGAEYTKFKE
jgi:hypothetical protein